MLPLQSRCCGKGSGDGAPWEAPPSSRSPQLCSENWENQVHVPQELGVGRNLLDDLNIREKRSVGRNSRGELRWLPGLVTPVASAALLQGASSQLYSATVLHASGRQGSPRRRESLRAMARKRKPGVGGVTGAEKRGRSNPAQPPAPKSFIPLGLF